MVRCLFRSLAVVLLGACLASPAALSAPSESWKSSIIGQLQVSEYHFSEAEGGVWTAPNRAQDLRVFLSSAGLRIEPRMLGTAPWKFRLALAGLGRAQALALPEAPQVVSADPGRIELRRPQMTEWYTNGPRGLEQGFTLTGRPDGDVDDELIVELQFEGDLAAQLEGDADVRFYRPGTSSQVLRYSDLRVVDARGRKLPSRIDIAGNRLRILSVDRGAEYPVTIDPLVTSPDWSVLGGQGLSGFASVLAAAGDVNCDGFKDVIIGAPFFDNGQGDEGMAFVYKGADDGISTTPYWKAEGNHAAGRFGVSVASAGDVNHDGCGDIIIGASFYDTAEPMQTDEGVAFVFYGSASGLGPNGSPANADWRAEGNQQVANLGIAVASAGDVNNDTYDDVLVGAYKYDNGQNDEGAVFLFRGSANGLALVGNTRPVGSPLNADWIGQSNLVGAHFGQAVASAGDVNGDGKDDVIIGAPSYQNTFANEGRAFLYLGAASPTYVNPTPIWILDGGQNGAELGISVSSAGDVNGDNKDDVIVGADAISDGQVFEGEALVFYGVATGLLGTTPSWKGQVDQGSAFYGFAVSSAGDVNNDGYDDVIVGADAWDNGELDEGGAFLYYGSPSGLALTPSRSFEIDIDGAEFGTSVAGLGDANGDGYGDLVIGADLLTQTFSEEGGAVGFFGCQDSDRDGTCQAQDNCPVLENADQQDLDGDGVGDVCDPCLDADLDLVCDEPRVLIEGSGPGEQVLVEFNAGMRFLANNSDPGGGLAWTQQVYPPEVNLPWGPGQYGVGYESSVGAEALINTTVPPGTLSVYSRATFPIADASQVKTLYIGADYDDGYIAWINGVEVYRSPEMPSGVPVWNTHPNPTHESSNSASPIYGALNDISGTGIPALIDGLNVLAVGVWNEGTGSSDLVVVPRLSINRPKTTTMRYQANVSAPSGGLIWTQNGFPDSTWTAGNYGVGFENGTAADELINTEITNAARSVYTRATVNVDVTTVDSIYLGADYDDGYVVWFNGTEVYRSPQMLGTAGTDPGWNANPNPQHESSNGAVPNYGTLLNLTDKKPLLVTGANIVAIGGWTSSPTGNDDLVLVPRLSVNEAGVDNCPGLYNPNQANLDLDGLGDACDPDIDGDGVLNATDNCPYFPNPTQTNSDSDANGNGCDVCPNDGTNDSDGDLICTGAGYAPPKVGSGDNCPSIANPRTDCDANPGTPPVQCDTDSDGLGDACDPDIDNDTKLNGADNCPYVANTTQINTDNDPNGDACDCAVSNNQAWQPPSIVTALLLARRDACANQTCTQSLAACTTDVNCSHDQCTNKTCTQSLLTCTSNANCNQNVCTSYNCTAGGNDCLNDAECTADFCTDRHCTSGNNLCTNDANCTADQCASKKCIETLGFCTTHTDCPGGVNDLCLGICTVGGNACAANSACVLDTCGDGTCSEGNNTCGGDEDCTSDVCRGNCTVGGASCASSATCTLPQTDLCKGTCSMGAHPVCSNDSTCTVPQTDLCRGTCSISNSVCATSSTCLGAVQDNMFWRKPLVPGGATMQYDTLRSPVKTNFTTSGTCVESNGTNQITLDSTLPSSGTVLFYLIRAENGCPTGNMGTDWLGNAHVGKNCP